MAKSVGLESIVERGRPRDPAIDGAVLDAVLRLLPVSGVSGTSMEKVAAEAGVSKVTVYARYSSKSALIGAALEHLQIGDLPELSGELEQDMVDLLAAMRRQYARVGGMGIVGTCLATEAHDARFLEAIRASTLWPRRATFGRVLCRGIEEGELPAGANIEGAISMLIGSFYADYLAGRPIDADWDRRVVRAVLGSLRGVQ